MENRNQNQEGNDQLRRSQNGTQWGSDKNHQHDGEQNIEKTGGDRFLANDSNPDDLEDWGNVDPRSNNYDPDTDPSGPGSAV